MNHQKKDWSYHTTCKCQSQSGPTLKKRAYENSQNESRDGKDVGDTPP